MHLSIGDKVGPYEVIAPLGAGGMGEVYRSRDTKLKREVAIKVLPEAFARDPERMARFQREAEVLASLNHPNIAAIYGIEERALVMELVEGAAPTGPIPFDEAWKIASQITAGLEYAHDRGIVHRDLKPANIKVTPEGVVKLLDFGLAKAFSTQAENSAVTAAGAEHSPTLTIGATGVGMILGTAAYMAPEQARGKSVDKRADIWAFGVVFYELLTGEHLFDGEDATEILAAVIHKHPDVTKAPERARPLLQACLEKDLKKRLKDIGDAARLIEDRAPANPTEAVGLPPKSSMWNRISWAAAAVFALAAALSGFAYYRSTRPQELPLLRFTDQAGAEINLTSQIGASVAFSPDGARIAYVSRDSGGGRGATHVALRLLENPKATVLAGTEGAQAPFFSPDGRWIGFIVPNQAGPAATLKKISVNGGAAATLCDPGGLPRGGAAWGGDGNVYFANQQSPVMRVPAAGGTPRPVTELDKKKGEVSHRGVRLLPGGEAFLFDASNDNNTWEDASIEVQSIQNGRRKTLVQGGYAADYIHGADPFSGHLIYIHGGTLFAAPMDLKRLELTGAAVPVLEDMLSRQSNGLAHFALTASGTMAYIAGDRPPSMSLFWLDAAGNTQDLGAVPSDSYSTGRISPDGTRIAMTVANGTAPSLVVYELSQKRMTKLVSSPALGRTSAWAPDGKHIVFSMRKSGTAAAGLYWIRADGGGEQQRIAESNDMAALALSPDGKHLLFANFEAGGISKLD